MMRVYFDPSWLNGIPEADFVPVVLNLLQSEETKRTEDTKSLFARDHFVKYVNLEGVIKVSSVEESDVILFPIVQTDLRRSELVASRIAELHPSIAELSEKHNKRVVLHCNARDITGPVKLLPNLNVNEKWHVLSSTLVGSRCSVRMRGLPHFVPDHLTKYYSGSLGVLKKTEKPTIGFCGFAPPLKTKWSRTTLLDWGRLSLTYLESLGIDSNSVARSLGTNIKHAHRARMILQLRRSEQVDLRCLLRDSSALNLNTRYYDEPDQSPFNRDFYDNIRQSLYTLCSRGTENYSIRFYETLCLGRIPVLVDTDVVLPFQSKLDFEKHCVIIPRGKIHETAKRVRRHHDRLSPGEVEAVQVRNRNLWLEYLSFRGFYSHLVDAL